MVIGLVENVRGVEYYHKDGRDEQTLLLVNVFRGTVQFGITGGRVRRKIRIRVTLVRGLLRRSTGRAWGKKKSSESDPEIVRRTLRVLIH